MDDQLDKDIKNRIREVFDNYDAPSADEGWLLLREKFPEKTKRRAIVWLWWSAAALILLFLGVGLFEFEKNNSPVEITAIKKHNTAPHQNVIAQKSNKKTTNGTPSPVIKNENKSISESIAKNSVNNVKPVHSPPVSSANTSKFIPGVNDASKKTSLAVDLRPVQSKPVGTANTPDFMPVISDKSNKITRGVKSRDSILQNKIQPPPNQFAATVQTNTNKQVTGANKPGIDDRGKNAPPVNKPATPSKSIASMFAEDDQPVNKKIDGEKKVHFGVYAATYFNYAKGSGNQANLGAGVTSEITLTKNLKLVTGITIAQNSLAFNNSSPAGGSQNFPLSPTAAGIAAGNAPAANFSQMALFSTGVVNTASVPTYKNYNASLVGLDIPLNLKYEFNPKKNDFYVLAGFSSGTFVNETYTYQYNYPALASPGLQQLKNETSHNSFNGFYVGKMLNFAVGVGYPLGKNRIVLEPFLKYPLQGLGSQDIKFGAGGVNLKFNFTTNKK
ncbi:outer membrane beta-barrel protein [Mucilaginibacter sp.]|uniref:outer membrane beta-barrel protein n=1 Tax=Mucilaginibacter sp. TaxID=1882438 RepID=UPI00284E6783|nr:outer membrane beta-barrel protein [Mucilaginibacter sp.]MDR3693955.1 outer membrane beta-barrel protein [Mucilaginibacter sp.]